VLYKTNMVFLCSRCEMLVANQATQVYFTEVMPKTATGKIQRRIVAETMQKQELKAKL
jgi:acyl-coenzyme A synthetase/AMP-(fatty) acid ligase